jgi:plasmid stability protein
MTVMVQVRNVPEELAAELKARAAMRRMSLSDYLLERLAEIAAEPTLEDVLNRLVDHPRRDLGMAAADLLAEVRQE